MIAVVDASVALKWFFDEPHADRADAVLRDVGAGRLPGRRMAKGVQRMARDVRRCSGLAPDDGSAMRSASCVQVALRCSVSRCVRRKSERNRRTFRKMYALFKFCFR